MNSALSYRCLRVGDYCSGFSTAHKFLGSNLVRPCKSGVQAFARRKSVKKLTNGRDPDSDVSIGNAKHLSGERSESADGAETKWGGVSDGRIISMPSRDKVLQACVVTSGLMAAVAFIIRQVRSTGRQPLLDDLLRGSRLMSSHFTS